MFVSRGVARSRCGSSRNKAKSTCRSLIICRHDHVTWLGRVAGACLYYFALMNTVARGLAGSQMVGESLPHSAHKRQRCTARWTARRGAPWQSCRAAASPLLSLGLMRPAAGGGPRSRDPALLAGRVHTRCSACRYTETVVKIHTIKTQSPSFRSSASHRAVLAAVCPFETIKAAARGLSHRVIRCVCLLSAD